MFVRSFVRIIKYSFVVWNNNYFFPLARGAHKRTTNNADVEADVDARDGPPVLSEPQSRWLVFDKLNQLFRGTEKLILLAFQSGASAFFQQPDLELKLASKKGGNF